MPRRAHNKKQFSPEQEQNIVDMYVQGKSTVKIAEKYNCGRGPITRILREKGVQVANNGVGRSRVYTQQQIDEAKRLYVDEGLGSGEIAKKMDLRDCDAALYLLRQAGVDRDPQGGAEDRRARYTKLDTEEIRTLYWEEGLDVPQIAERLNETRQVITKAMKRADIGRRPRGSDQMFDRSKISQILDAYLNLGMTQVQTGEKFGCSHRTVGLILQREGREARKYMGGWDTISDALNSQDLKYDEECSFYTYKTCFGEAYRNFGISKDLEARASLVKSDGLYEELIDQRWLPSRRHAILIEKSVLRDPSLSTDIPQEILELAGGHEVRKKNDWDGLDEWITSLVESIFELQKEDLTDWAWENIHELKEYELTS